MSAAGDSWSFWVPGKPITKGSLTPFQQRDGRGRVKVVVKDKPEADAWKRTMVKDIRAQFSIVPVIGVVDGQRGVVGFEAPWPVPAPVMVTFTAYFARLCDADNELSYPTREGGMYAHGDGDKLERCLWDALTQSGLIADDSNVVDWRGQKRWAFERPMGTFGIHGPGIYCRVEVAP